MAEEARSTIQKRDDKGAIRHGGEWLAIWSDPDSLKSDAEKRAEQRRDQAFDEMRALLAASARSISGIDDLEVVFDRHLPQSAKRIVLTPIDADSFSLPAARGESDARASFLRWHEPELFAGQRPEDGDAAQLLGLLEHVRCEAISARDLPGMATNLVAHHRDRLHRAQLLNAHLASLLPLSEALRMVVRDELLGWPEPSIQTAGLRMWDRWLRDRFSADLARLATCMDDQAAYATVALELIHGLLAELPSQGRRSRRAASAGGEETAKPDGDPLREVPDGDEGDLFEPGATLFDENDAPAHTPMKAAPEPPRPYRVFTTEYDRVAQAADLFDRAVLTASRRHLDEKQAEYRQAFLHLVARLQRRLLALQTRQWEFDLEEGLIDASRLDRVVVNPGFSSVYKQEAESPFRDTLVTLLIDNSGSMRGKSIETACVVADILAAALERCAVATEVLGFTTSGWKGGQAAKAWSRAGRPDNPGRLNDLLHVIYKEADTPLRRARDSLCAMLSPDLLKENIDGEALQWAAGRMLIRPEQRKILIVISDGAPVDQATLERNDDKGLLDRHLRGVIDWIGTATGIELSAIGIRHDVSRYYDNAVQIDTPGGLGEAIVSLLDRYFDR